MDSILLIVFGSLGFGFFLIFLLGLADKKRKESNPSSEEPQGLTQVEFEKACVEIIERMKLDIQTIERSDENTLEIKAHNPAPITGGDFFFYTVYLPSNESVSSAEILEVSSMIIQDRLSKGILMTNTRFTDDLPAIAELAPMEFIDGQRLQSILADLPMV